jgi:hypothetical protein
MREMHFLPYPLKQAIALEISYALTNWLFPRPIKFS